jgi:hypothetical protein
LASSSSIGLLDRLIAVVTYADGPRPGKMLKFNSTRGADYNRTLLVAFALSKSDQLFVRILM